MWCPFYHVPGHHNFTPGHDMTAAVLRNVIKRHTVEKPPNKPLRSESYQAGKCCST